MRSEPRRSVGALVRRLATAVAAAALLANCGEPTADADQPAYDPTYGSSDVLYHWRAGATIRVYAQPSAAADSADLAGALRTAFDSWARVPELREYRLALVAAPADADVVVRIRDDAPIVSFGACRYPTDRASGITFLCPSATFDAVETLPLVAGGGHVKMDVAVASASQTSHFQSVVTHEIGHVLGIGAHSGSSADLMYPFPTVLAPSSRDVATLRYVLHRPSALVL